MNASENKQTYLQTAAKTPSNNNELTPNIDNIETVYGSDSNLEKIRFVSFTINSFYRPMIGVNISSPCTEEFSAGAAVL